MLPGLNEKSFQQLILSVGKTNAALRPLSPAEVGELCSVASAAGASRKEITRALRMTDTSMISKFISLLDLAPPIRHLVSWGRSKRGAIGFSVAAQLVRMASDQHEVVANSILRYDLTKSEMFSIIQLLDRSGQSLVECIERVVRRRPVVVERHVALGAVVSEELRTRLASMTQRQRDVAIQRVVGRLYADAGDLVAKLAADRFTIVGGRRFAASLRRDVEFEVNISNGLTDEVLGRCG